MKDAAGGGRGQGGLPGTQVPSSSSHRDWRKVRGGSAVKGPGSAGRRPCLCTVAEMSFNFGSLIYNIAFERVPLPSVL